jgi:hypothetical protein
MSTTTARAGTWVFGAVMLLASCGTGAAPGGQADATGNGFEPVTTAAEFRAAATGRPLLYPDGDVMRYGRDGTWRVERDGAIVATGTWSWQDGRWCGEGAARGGPVAPQCQVVAASPVALRFTRPDGRSQTLAFAG